MAISALERLGTSKKGGASAEELKSVWLLLSY
jgi:hypothetical protein